MRIGIITVAWNSAATISDTCWSIRNQEVNDCQHLVIDGASTDGTQEVVQDAMHANGRIISEPDNGLYDAMNKGLRLSKGDIIGFLNADDVYADEHVLRDVAAAFADPNVDAVFGNLVYVAQDNLNKVVRYWDSSRFTPAAFRYGVMPPHPTLYIRRSVIERCGGFRLDMAMANDFEFCVRYFAKYRIRAKHLNRVMVKMRLGGESNRSLRNVWRQNVCIQQALRLNGLAPHPLYPLVKGLDKGRQFLRPLPPGFSR